MNFLVNLNLNKNELQNAVIQPLSTAPASAVQGQIYYNTVDKVLYQYDGTNWKQIGTTYVLPAATTSTLGGVIVSTGLSVDAGGNTTVDYGSSNPAMDGTASAGSANSASRSDHIHPTDTSRAPTSHAAAATTYGAGSGTNYGHVKLSDSTSSSSDVDSGTAATPAAVKAVAGAIPSATTTTPAMDGTAAVGSETAWAKGDHVHPTDTSRAPTSHASSATTYGTGTSSNYGHLKLSDSTSSTSGTSDGIAATPSAVKAVKDAIPAASTSTPVMDGVGSAGSATSWAKGDHVHPSDTSRAAATDLAPAYSTSSAYAVGAYCVKDGVLYECNTAISSGGEAWNSAHWDAVNITSELGDYAPLNSPALTGTPTAPTAANGTNTTQIATTAFVQNTLAYADAMVFKGTIGAAGDSPTVTALPDTHNAGWTYKVITAGTYAGYTCEVGDMIICVKDGTAASNADWTVVQTNIDGAVTGPASSTSGHIPTFNGASGKVIQDGYGVASSISNDATTIPTTAAVNTAVTGLIKTATGTISTSQTSASVSYTGTLINAYAKMSNAIVQLDISIAASSVTFSTAQSPSSAVTCTVVYA